MMAQVRISQSNKLTCCLIKGQVELHLYLKLATAQATVLVYMASSIHLCTLESSIPFVHVMHPHILQGGFFALTCNHGNLFQLIFVLLHLHSKQKENIILKINQRHENPRQRNRLFPILTKPVAKFSRILICQTWHLALLIGRRL